MSPSKTAAPGRLLTQVAGERQTGTLVVGGHPGGTVYLLEGAVVYAESPAAPGVGELLTASGRLAGRTWQAALDAGAPGARVGRLLLEQGHLTQGELELCVLGAIYDAALLRALPADRAGRIPAGATHWLGPVIRVDAAAVDREARRRARLLDEIFPHPRVRHRAGQPGAPAAGRTGRADRGAVGAAGARRRPAHPGGPGPAARPGRLRDDPGTAQARGPRPDRACPAGRDDSPDFVRLPRARGIAVDIRRPVVTLDDGRPASWWPTVLRHRAIRRRRRPSHPRATARVYRPPRLARRKPGAKLPKELAADTAAGAHRHRRGPAQAHPHRTAGTAVTRAPPEPSAHRKESRGYGGSGGARGTRPPARQVAGALRQRARHHRRHGGRARRARHRAGQHRRPRRRPPGAGPTLRARRQPRRVCGSRWSSATADTSPRTPPARTPCSPWSPPGSANLAMVHREARRRTAAGDDLTLEAADQAPTGDPDPAVGTDAARPADPDGHPGRAASCAGKPPADPSNGGLPWPTWTPH